MTSEVNSEQAKWWNAAGEGWANAQDIVDLVLRPLEELLAQKALERPRHRVLDVGCGTGAVTRAIAKALGDAPECVGLDISQTMIAGAAREGNVRFVVADAQTHTFDETFDLVVSRFGVMFFEDPTAAFRNLLRATTPGGELCFITWRTPEENSFMTTAQKAAAPLLPDAPPLDPNGPGPFSLADADNTKKLFEQGGWDGVVIQPVDRVCTMPEKLLVPYLSNLGPIARAIKAADVDERPRIIDDVRGAFDEFVHGDEVRVPAACWQITASAPL
ncbi:class I SAM-dependent methyltransferase [Lentzea sp. NPDC051838]|uniref:class I SAM-dependent methyltransferase n=1 Tax=Lentzea sp. NPDC051838 TaxID=3154849 RepID=UPI00342D6B45